MIGGGAMGPTLSTINAKSSDFVVGANPDPDGIALVVYKTGGTMNVSVSKGTASESFDDQYMEVRSSGKVRVGDVDAVYHEYVNPNTVDGLLLDAHLVHDGNTYTFSFGYNPTTFPQGKEIFKTMLKSVQFSQ